MSSEPPASTASSLWQPGPRPAWVRGINGLGDPAWISLEPEALVADAASRTGLDDFGGESWREGYRVFLEALEKEAQLTLVGRVLARSDVVNWLENRLRITEVLKRHPEIGEEALEQPIFITGLPRTGTSLLHELLACDPGARVPLAWEVRHPCPPPRASTRDTDPRIARADLEIRLWCEIVPEYDSMHELGARVPVECIQITAHEFRSDELSGRHLVPTYAAWLAGADLAPAYAFHRRMLQLLQWKTPGERWVLKAPSHLGALRALLAVYPDARIVQTHRDPLRVMASVASILYSTAFVRSDAVDPEQVLQWFTGETCRALLDGATALRETETLPPDQVFDVCYGDLMADPIGAIAGIYHHFAIPFRAEAESRMRATLAAKPQGRHGLHRYEFGHTGFDREAERRRFADYQERYRVASEL